MVLVRDRGGLVLAVLICVRWQASQSVLHPGQPLAPSRASVANIKQDRLDFTLALFLAKFKLNSMPALQDR